MKTSIHLYLDNEDETPIDSFYDVTYNPFKVGDVVHFEINDPYPAEYAEFKPEAVKRLKEDNDKLRQLVGRKWVKLIREGKYINTRVGKEAKLTIEYHCEIVTDEQTISIL